MIRAFAVPSGRPEPSSRSIVNVDEVGGEGFSVDVLFASRCTRLPLELVHAFGNDSAPVVNLTGRHYVESQKYS
jgi:hypothetical protein